MGTVETGGRIGAVGSSELMLQFRAAGVMVKYSSTVDEGVKAVTELVRSGCMVVFVSDELLEGMKEILSHYSAEPWPLITGFPGRDSGTANSQRIIKDLVRKAVGIDIAGVTE